MRKISGLSQKIKRKINKLIYKIYARLVWIWVFLERFIVKKRPTHWHYFDITNKKTPFIFKWFLNRNYIRICDDIKIIKDSQIVDTSTFKDKFVYKDEKWNYISNFIPNYLLVSLRLPVFMENNFCENKKLFIKDNSVILQDYKRENNDWIYWYYQGELPQKYVLEFDTTIYDIFDEWQIAFRHNSISKRYRFVVHRNEYLSFGICDFGYIFYKMGGIVPFRFEIGKKYAIQIVVNDNIYSIIVNNKIIMTIKDQITMSKGGGVAFIFYQQLNNNGKINVAIDNIQIHTIK
jgi:hypothetical protein